MSDSAVLVSLVCVCVHSPTLVHSCSLTPPCSRPIVPSCAVTTRLTGSGWPAGWLLESRDAGASRIGDEDARSALGLLFSPCRFWDSHRCFWHRRRRRQAVRELNVEAVRVCSCILCPALSIEDTGIRIRGEKTGADGGADGGGGGGLLLTRDEQPSFVVGVFWVRSHSFVLYIRSHALTAPVF